MSTEPRAVARPEPETQSRQRGRVLFVTLRFPPHGGAGVQRTSRFVRYLHEFGWLPHVLTGPLVDSRAQRDPTMLEVIPREVPVTRTGRFDTRPLFRSLGRLHLARMAKVLSPSFPNMDAGWIPHAYQAGRRLLREDDFDLICSSAYPMSSHVVAYLLKRETGLPWVADYRDEWSMRKLMRWPTRWHRSLARKLDLEIARVADRIITTTDHHTASFARHFPPAGNGKLATIPNGFDEEEFLRPLREPPELPRDRLVLTHVGSLFRWRRPERFFAAIERLVRSGALPTDRLAIPLVGQPSGLGSLHLHLRKRGIVREVGFVSHHETIHWIRCSNALLLINTERTNIPAKTFDYLASGRPVLAITPEGPTTDLLRRARAGWVVDPGDAEGLDRAILELFNRWEAGLLRSTTDPTVVREYSRRRLTGRLAAVLDGVAAPGVPQTEEG